MAFSTPGPVSYYTYRQPQVRVATLGQQQQQPQPIYQRPAVYNVAPPPQQQPMYATTTRRVVRAPVVANKSFSESRNYVSRAPVVVRRRAVDDIGVERMTRTFVRPAPRAMDDMYMQTRRPVMRRVIRRPVQAQTQHVGTNPVYIQAPRPVAPLPAPLPPRHTHPVYMMPATYAYPRPIPTNVVMSHQHHVKTETAKSEKAEPERVPVLFSLKSYEVKEKGYEEITKTTEFPDEVIMEHDFDIPIFPAHTHAHTYVENGDDEEDCEEEYRIETVVIGKDPPPVPNFGEIRPPQVMNGAAHEMFGYDTYAQVKKGQSGSAGNGYSGYNGHVGSTYEQHVTRVGPSQQVEILLGK